MADISAEVLAERAHDVGLLTDWEIRQIWSELGRKSVSLDEFIQFLVRREYLTNYQAEKLLNGDRDGFFYRDYKFSIWLGPVHSPVFSERFTRTPRRLWPSRS